MTFFLIYLTATAITFIGVYPSEFAKEITKSRKERIQFSLFFSFFWWVSLGLVITDYLDRHKDG